MCFTGTLNQRLGRQLTLVSGRLFSTPRTSKAVSPLTRSSFNLTALTSWTAQEHVPSPSPARRSLAPRITRAVWRPRHQYRAEVGVPSLVHPLTTRGFPTNRPSSNLSLRTRLLSAVDMSQRSNISLLQHSVRTFSLAFRSSLPITTKTPICNLLGSLGLTTSARPAWERFLASSRLFLPKSGPKCCLQGLISKLQPATLASGRQRQVATRQMSRRRCPRLSLRPALNSCCTLSEQNRPPTTKPAHGSSQPRLLQLLFAWSCANSTLCCKILKKIS
mmetsp:Transcript_15549/g.30536  ORF Transcript_15549/g.30536 Transcript_15549/m.30536 type:complete len:276 (+) Transcript_15549:136-963(+)